MSGGTVADETIRQRWARLAGLLYLVTNLSAGFAFWTRSQVIVRNDAAATAANLVSNEALFRVGLAAELLTILGVLPLVVGLYLTLRPIGHGTALVALTWRILENVALTAATFFSFAAMALASGEHLAGADVPTLQAIGYGFFPKVYGAGFQIGFLFLGLGSTLFAWLWWRSRFVPRVLSGLGIGASLLLATSSLAAILSPALMAGKTMMLMMPMGLFEISLGLWLLVKGVRPAT